MNRDRKKRDSLFFRVVMTVMVTVAFFVIGGLLAGGLVWGYSVLGPVVVVIVLGVALVVTLAWVVSGWLLK